MATNEKQITVGYASEHGEDCIELSVFRGDPDATFLIPFRELSGVIETALAVMQDIADEKQETR